MKYKRRKTRRKKYNLKVKKRLKRGRGLWDNFKRSWNETFGYSGFY